MHYYGGKYRSGKEIAEIIKELMLYNELKGYIEPFCGALGVLKHMTNNVYPCYASDGCEDLIMLWIQVQNNEFKKPFMNEEIWTYLKKSNEPSALRAYAGFGLSYSGKWFSSYSQKYIGLRDQNKESYNSILKITPNIKNVSFSHRDYRNHLKQIESGGYLIYCDPPYVNSVNKHIGSSFNFDIVEFWSIMRLWRSWDNIVVVSERSAPDDFKCIWSRKLLNLDKTLYIDKLFI